MTDDEVGIEQEEQEPIYTPEQGATEGQFVVDLMQVHIGERHRKDLGDVTDLAEDLYENGQYQPILLRLPIPEYDETRGWKEEPYVLVAGGRRMAAAMRLGWPQLAAFVREDIDEPLKHLVSELHENLKRHDMTWQEQAEMKKKILGLRREQDPDITAKEVAIEIGDNPSSFSRDVDAAKAIEERPELKKASSRKAALRARDTAALLEARIAREEENKEVLETVTENIQTAEALDFLQQFDNSFDLCITDPPWGIEYFKAGEKGKKKRQEDYDDSTKNALNTYRQTFPALARAMRETGWVLMFGGIESIEAMRLVWDSICRNHYGRRTDEGWCFNVNKPKEDGPCDYYKAETIPWIWHRPNSRNPSRYPERLAQNMYELILVVNMGKALLAKPTQNVFECDSVYGDERVHANQKPIDLGKMLLEQIGFPGDRFVDPFHGSGAFLAAASSMSMFVFGCDDNELMHGPAVGLTTHHYKPAPPSVRDQSEARFKKRLETLSFNAEPPRGEADGADEEGTLHDDGEEG